MDEENIRIRFESWATSDGLNLARHPLNNDYYYINEVTKLWLCWLAAYSQALNGGFKAKDNVVYL